MLRKFKKDQRGSTVIEYGLIAALIALTLIGSMKAIGSNATVTLENVSDQF